jgi:hypothetical protein
MSAIKNTKDFSSAIPGEYEKKGFYTEPGFFSASELLPFKQLAGTLIINQCSKLEDADLKNRILSLPADELLHQGLCLLPKEDVRIVVDKLMASAYFHAFITQEKIIQLAGIYRG